MLFICFVFLKSIKQAMLRVSYRPIVSFFGGCFDFLKDIPYVVKKRKEIQLKRVVQDDIFLKIKPPKLTCNP